MVVLRLFHLCYLYSLFPLYKHLFKIAGGTNLLFVLEHAVHTFFAINLSKKKKAYSHGHHTLIAVLVV